MIFKVFCFVFLFFFLLVYRTPGISKHYIKKNQRAGFLIHFNWFFISMGSLSPTVDQQIQNAYQVGKVKKDESKTENQFYLEV